MGKAKVLVLGAGGLGGYVIEMLARLGVGHLTIMDGDVFDATNLNRQLLATEDNLGEVKVLEAARRLQQINSQVVVDPVYMNIDAKNAQTFLDGQEVVVDCLDNITTRKMLAAQAAEMKVPVVHGAIAGWWGQVTTVLPGDDTLELLYPLGADKGIEEKTGNPAFTPAAVAAIQVAEVVKLLVGRGNLLSRRLLYIDLLDGEIQEIVL